MSTGAPLRVLLVAEGDAETFDCWSGSAVRFVTALRAAGHDVRTLNVELRGLSRYLGAALTWSPDWQRWRQRFILGSRTYRLRTRLARRRLRSCDLSMVDVVIQIGASFSLNGSVPSHVSHVVYADANGALARQAGRFSEIWALSEQEQRQLLDRERDIYASLDGIWTFSEYAKRSFVEDFGVPAERVTVIHGGANNVPSPDTRRAPGDPPRVLFVGRQHLRKGFDLVLQAFTRVRERFPTAELHLLGVPSDAPLAPGVVNHGLIRPDQPGGAERVAALYGAASVFCLPSRYEPFGVSFVEAMLAGLPCIAARAYAMPEIVQEGETGWLVDDGRVDQLEAALLDALGDPEEAERRGAAGRRRALSRFTWEQVALRAADAIRRLRSAPR